VTTVFKGLIGVETCGGGDLTLVTGYYRPGHKGLLGWWSFILGRFHRGRPSLSRFSRRRLSESLHLS